METFPGAGAPNTVEKSAELEECGGIIARIGRTWSIEVRRLLIPGS
jgi:hypothetical protein